MVRGRDAVISIMSSPGQPAREEYGLLLLWCTGGAGSGREAGVDRAVPSFYRLPDRGDPRDARPRMIVKSEDLQLLRHGTVHLTR